MQSHIYHSIQLNCQLDFTTKRKLQLLPFCWIYLLTPVWFRKQSFYFILYIFLNKVSIYKARNTCLASTWGGGTPWDISVIMKAFAWACKTECFVVWKWGGKVDLFLSCQGQEKNCLIKVVVVVKGNPQLLKEVFLESKRALAEPFLLLQPHLED